MKSNKNFRVLILLMILLSLLAFVGCSGKTAETDQSTQQAAETQDKPAYPEKPVEIIVPVPAGGSSDTVARLLAEFATKEFGQSFYVTNKPGGALTIGTAEMVKSAPDGYTLLATPLGPIVMQPHYKELPYKLDDIEPIAYTTARYDALAAKKGAFKDINALINYIKEKPGQAKYGNVAIGGLPHIATENWLMQIEGEATGIGFDGDADCMTALLGGHIDFAIIGGSFIEQYNAGNLDVFAIGAPERIQELPDVPTFKELGYDVDTMIWEGVFAPKGIPEDVADRLNEVLNKILNDPVFQEKAKVVGEYPNPMSREDFKAFVQKEFELYKKIINESPAGEKIKKAMTK